MEELPSGADAMPPFSAITKVHTDEGLVTETTPFARLAVSVFSSYMQPDVVAEGDYDYMDEPIWNNVGGVAFGGRRHPWVGAVHSRGHGIGGASSGSTSQSGGRGGTRSRPIHRGGTMRGGGGHASGGGRHR